jgi:hypothetical protein
MQAHPITDYPIIEKSFNKRLLHANMCEIVGCRDSECVLPEWLDRDLLSIDTMYYNDYFEWFESTIKRSDKTGYVIVNHYTAMPGTYKFAGGEGYFTITDDNG